MKQLIAAIYISFGFLFYIFTFFDSFHSPQIFNLIILLFIIVGIIYLINGLKDSLK